MYTITEETSLRTAIKDYLRFCGEERPQDRYHCKTPLEEFVYATYNYVRPHSYIGHRDLKYRKTTL